MDLLYLDTLIYWLTFGCYDRSCFGTLEHLMFGCLMIICFNLLCLWFVTFNSVVYYDWIWLLCLAVFVLRLGILGIGVIYVAC